MLVTIQEQKFSFAVKYDIETPHGPMFARKALMSVPAKIELSSGEDGPPIATLQGEFSLLRSRFEFLFADGRAYQFECEKRLKQVYVCDGGDEHYRLIEHHGMRWSVFLADRQIAAVTKSRMVVGDGNHFEIQMNSDADAAVIVSMVLAINTASGDDRNRESVTFDVGNIGPQEQAFDESWEPS
ncbi:MAG TPA: hypothetical protein VHX60_14215 [Acidobacteriaceae bacterium]|jgi:uncharacterized protein YxjI|nr:hypothetical protein [Acidobacteriaceae bacterium]